MKGREKKFLNRWNKIYFIAIIVLVVVIAGGAVYFFAVSQRDKDNAGGQSYEKKTIEACSDDAVREATAALKNKDNQKLYDLVNKAQEDDQFQSSAHCVYIAILYSMAIQDQLAAKGYLSVYEALPANARNSLESIDGVRELADLKSEVESMEGATNQLPTSDDSVPNTFTTPGDILNAADAEAAKEGGSQ